MIISDLSYLEPVVKTSAISGGTTKVITSSEKTKFKDEGIVGTITTESTTLTSNNPKVVTNLLDALTLGLL